ncbi:outer membrane beta-barrel protein [Flavobacterium rhizosphaerae]|uniref:Outer membrane beta-barrel protein n=1 Tax=Flavobacterium rhizosphaerae TaxID=3163298 RepID=A0ABW8Z0H7_9FLAO
MNLKRNLFLLVLLFSASVFSQNKNDQYSIEAGYGLGISGKPGITQLNHFEVGFRYMVDEFWGMKFDFGADKFTTTAEGADKETGTDYKRISVQAVHNLGRTLNLRESIANTNMLAHAGFGYSYMTTINIVTGKQDKTDSMGNFIIGITPQYHIIKNLALHADFSYIVNFSQNRDYDGNWHNQEDPIKGFTGSLANISVGLTFYFGSNSSDVDWR